MIKHTLNNTSCKHIQMLVYTVISGSSTLQHFLVNKIVTLCLGVFVFRPSQTYYPLISSSHLTFTRISQHFPYFHFSHCTVQEFYNIFIILIPQFQDFTILLIFSLTTVFLKLTLITSSNNFKTTYILKIESSVIYDQIKMNFFKATWCLYSIYKLSLKYFYYPFIEILLSIFINTCLQIYISEVENKDLTAKVFCILVRPLNRLGESGEYVSQYLKCKGRKIVYGF
ncbi:hypothetical protein PHYBLDRAFT_70731 [Phycomyces blakesleeanus NRRL 1555(-)]|uniref:Uncharacterized protein n=1 Tax=Phycomyces blakesleeanus (strain ATCC 8743b / DSM 1359 / FGSC 10004 / NBRC 33097 / NRRL 1555) TaxID=763407 RepID=A0A162TAX3_PHYB8|nr:hypothetical protein PHYBLDRAFT_70731 [Phycomyces blakesleeanus NRRL 1555(-)]OAD65613.1 hypothetical protein PHYBLDRAFT_70731 [Phycomyces blakesleeanus NRRL 1555(-)]|eukprot:XP_018283653.1 hypothetical protein PHYBLDRAFT_70731 [Phycomyces blakesleeanus NRRL 1555(-)]